MLGADVTVSVGPAGLETPPAAVTTIDPVVAPAGTTAVMLLVVQLVIDVAGVPLNFTPLPVPWVLKFVPAIVTYESTAPEFGVRLVMLGADVTVNVGPAGLETPPAAVTTTDPVVAPAGTTAVMLLVVQLVIDVAGVAPNFTALPAPWALKFVPAMVIEELDRTGTGRKTADAWRWSHGKVGTRHLFVHRRLRSQLHCRLERRRELVL